MTAKTYLQSYGIQEYFMIFKRNPLIGIFVLLLGISPMTYLEAAQPSPQALILDASTKLKAKLQEKEFSTNFIKLTQYVNSLIQPLTNFNLISSLVLGKSWTTATVSDQENFKKEFQTLLIRTYSRAFMEFKDWEIRYLPLNMKANANKVVVKTEVLQPSVPSVAVNYRMALNDGNWKVYDIMIEGVSLVTNYRTVFKNEIQSKGGSLKAVIDILAKRNIEALSSNNPGK